jgi:hypothetical protein
MCCAQLQLIPYELSLLSCRTLLHAQQSAGAECEYMALATLVPFG